MIGVLKKIWDFAGEEQDNIRKSMILGFFYAVFHMFQIAAIYVVVLALVGGSTDPAPAWQALGLLLASILGRAVLNRFSQLQQTHAGYFMVANKRISIGDKLKRVPMGYFNDQSLGELTGITTTVLDEVESTGPMVLVGILGGLINSAVMLLCVLFWDWRIGLLALAGMLVYLALLSAMEKQSAKIAPKRQRDEARLVEAVLEQLQGMSVIKSFNLTGKGDKRVRQALEDSRANNLAVEKLFTPYIWGQEMVLHLFSVLILAASVGLCLTGAMSLANALMAVIVSFLIFSQIQSAGSGVSALPDGYNTVIGEGGATLSGGEKQRISIARCLLKDAPIVIFDEATANVDPENEDQLQRAMEALTREKTVLMIAHRLKTVRGADQILVLDQGSVVQKGTHDELIQQAGIYRDFVSERTESSRWTL